MNKFASCLPFVFSKKELFTIYFLELRQLLRKKCLLFIKLILSNTLIRMKQRPGVVLWKSALKHFAKFTEKHLCRSLSHKVRLQASNFIKETLPQVLPCEISEILRTPIFQNICGRLLLSYRHQQDENSSKIKQTFGNTLRPSLRQQTKFLFLSPRQFKTFPLHIEVLLVVVKAFNLTK